MLSIKIAPGLVVIRGSSARRRRRNSAMSLFPTLNSILASNFRDMGKYEVESVYISGINYKFNTIYS